MCFRFIHNLENHRFVFFFICIGTVPNIEAQDEDLTLNELCVKITENIGDGCEMTYDLDQKFKPLHPLFEIKLNDPLSGNMPFKENVCILNFLLENVLCFENEIEANFLLFQIHKDRSYLVDFGETFEEVVLSAHVIGGLIKWNEKERGNQQMDKVFLKALLIGVFTIKVIKSAAKIDKFLLKFVKGKKLSFYYVTFQNNKIAISTDIFAVRVGEDAVRLQEFDVLVHQAYEDLRRNILK